jgi:hypothetical protein
MGARVCAALREVFAGDARGDVSLEAVRVLTRFVRTRNYRLPAAALDTLQSLRLLDELAPADAKAGPDGASTAARGGKGRRHESRASRKVSRHAHPTLTMPCKRGLTRRRWRCRGS